MFIKIFFKLVYLIFVFKVQAVMKETSKTLWYFINKYININIINILILILLLILL